jgi:MFS family permease
VPKQLVVRRPPGERTLLRLLSVVMLLEGFDEALLALLAPQIKRAFAVDEQAFGATQAVIQLGLFAALIVTLRADRFGRRSTCIIAIVGASTATALTALAPSLTAFAAAQFGARVFLGALYVLAILIVVETVPAYRRGAALSQLLGANAVGILLTGIVVGLGVQQPWWSWRWPFLIGAAPLLLWPALSRVLQETHHRLDVPGQPAGRPSWRRIWTVPHRAALALIGIVTALRAVPLFASIAWFAYYAEDEVALSTSRVSVIFLIAFAVGVAGYRLCGLAMDRYGRRTTATTFLLATTIAGPLAFRQTNPWLLALFLTATIFFGMGIEPVLGALTVELFPPELRGAASAWSRNVFQVLGFAAGPALVGWLGDHDTGAIGRIGPAVAVTFPMLGLAAVILYQALPRLPAHTMDANPAPDPTTARPPRS